MALRTARQRAAQKKASLASAAKRKRAAHKQKYGTRGKTTPAQRGARRARENRVRRRVSRATTVATTAGLVVYAYSPLIKAGYQSGSKGTKKAKVKYGKYKTNRKFKKIISKY